MAGRIFSIYCVGRSKWKDNFSLLIAFDAKTQFNKAACSYILPQLFAYLIYFLAVSQRDCITANEVFSMVCLHRAVLGTPLVCFHYSSFLSSHPTVRICN